MTVLTPARRELYSTIPEQIRNGLVHHFVYGYPMGSFMLAVMTNDLRGVFRVADEPSSRGLHAIMAWCYSFGPMWGQGSEDAVREWPGTIALIERGATAHASLPRLIVPPLTEGLRIFSALGDTVAAGALLDIKAAELALTAKGS